MLASFLLRKMERRRTLKATVFTWSTERGLFF